VAVEVVATQPTDADHAIIGQLTARDGRALPPVAYVIKVRLRTMPPPTARGWALYVGEFRIPKYWEYRVGIYFKVFDPQFILDHQGERVRFSQDDTHFVDTGLRLTRPPALPGTARGRTRARTGPDSLPLQSEVLQS
jgi:hypothetical protein